ncbi:MAG TPA: hypothetical protein VIE64_00850 [Solirubrobacterales bacterium]|jgi:hypothetical protein
MKSNAVRVLLGIGLAALAVVLLIVLKDDGSDDGGGATTAAQNTENSKSSEGPATPTVPVIVIKGGKPVGGVKELSFNEGDRIRFKVSSDTSDEIHIHGYDVESAVTAGGSVSFDFPATIEGIFEAELHGSGEQIAEIQVNP